MGWVGMGTSWLGVELAWGRVGLDRLGLGRVGWGRVGLGPTWPVPGDRPIFQIRWRTLLPTILEMALPVP